jgi:hypothetical protein
MEGQKPLVERDMRALEQRADRHSELLGAALALVEPRTMALAAQCVGRADQATVRTDRPVRPQKLLQPLTGFLGIVENRVISD